MADAPAFPEDDETVRATLARALELKRFEREARLVQLAGLRVQFQPHDNWDSGTDYFSLSLKVSLELFVELEPTLPKTEKRILETAQSVWREQEYHRFSSVTISPVPIAASGQPLHPIQPLAVPGFWGEHRFRLFVSHCSTQKAEVMLLRDALRVFGIAAFVAHEDVEPNKPWQAEIERALQSMEALCAVMSADFVMSRWCDQEVGFALGSGRPVVSVRFGADPHGFLGKVQAFPGGGANLAAVGPALCQTFMRDPKTSVSMTNAIICALESADSYANAKTVAAALEHVPNLDSNHAVAIRRAVKDNSQVRDAFGVPDRIDRVLRAFKHTGIAA